MAYAELLNKIINNTNYSNVEIANKCKELGVNVDRTYINKLLNKKATPPKDEISRAIAKVCNADERLLVLEGYLEKAPKEIREAFQQIKYLTSLATLNIFENNFKEYDNFLDELKLQLEKEPLADFILQLLDNGTTNINFNELGNINFHVENKNYNINLTTPIDIIVNDKAMFPLIQENSHIHLTLKDKYENGDIIAFKIKGKEELLVRYIFYTDTQLMLTALEKDYKPIICNENDILIMGKVNKVIIEI